MSDWSQLSVLVTGGTGFVGANLVRRLLEDGHDVHLFVRRGYRDWRIKNLLPHLQLHTVDLLDASSLSDAVADARPAWVFHLAAYGAYSWQDRLNEAIQTNFLGTLNLLEACRAAGFESFIHAGSSSEYGPKAHPSTEDDLPEPDSAYALAKVSATSFCRYTGWRFGLPVHTLRLYSVFGPYEEPGRLIPALVVHGLRGQLPPLAHPATARDFIFTEDVTRIFLQIAASAASLPPGEIYNLGSGRQTTLREAVEVARDVLGIAAEPTWESMSPRPWDTPTWLADNTKLRATGWEPQFDFRAGFLRTVEWFRGNGELVREVYVAM